GARQQLHVDFQADDDAVGIRHETPLGASPLAANAGEPSQCTAGPPQLPTAHPRQSRLGKRWHSRRGGPTIRGMLAPTHTQRSDPMRPAVLACCLACLLPAAARADLERAPTFEQSVGLKRPQQAQISPDGQYVAYTVQEADWKENSFESQIWLVATATGER